MNVTEKPPFSLIEYGGDYLLVLCRDIIYSMPNEEGKDVAGG